MPKRSTPISKTLPNASDQSELFGSVLASVSRSFYLTIQALPGSLRRPVGLAYLLARTSDTIADSAGAPAESRVLALSQFGDAIHGRGPLPELASLQSGVSDEAERALLLRTEALLELLHATEPGDRAEIIRVLDEILRGQTLDVQRFAPAGGGQIRALANAGELDDYTYSVAGCVGEFWTRICYRHLPNYSRNDPQEMIRLGIAFGKGLQLINILRDLPVDLRNGRCYLPADQLQELGQNPTDLLLGNTVLTRSVVGRWMAQAREHLAAGLDYIEGIQPWRLRLACFLPWAIGMKTLDLLEQTPPLDTAQRVKVSRKVVRRLLFWGVLAAVSNGVLRWFACRNVRKY